VRGESFMDEWVEVEDVEGVGGMRRKRRGRRGGEVWEKG
jgi:hypothetical protein